MCCLGAGVIRTTNTSSHLKGVLLKGNKFQYNNAYMYNNNNTLKMMLAMLDYIFGKTNYHKIEIVIRNSCCFQNLHTSCVEKKSGYTSALKYCTSRTA